jgi:hypothetical protein
LFDPTLIEARYKEQVSSGFLEAIKKANGAWALAHAQLEEAKVLFLFSHYLVKNQ